MKGNALLLVVMLLVPGFTAVAQEPTRGFIDPDGGQVIIEITINYLGKETDLVMRLAPITYDQYFSTNAAMVIPVPGSTLLLAHAGYGAEGKPNQVDKVRQYLQGGSEKTRWELFDRPKMMDRLATFEGASVSIFQGERRLDTVVKAATVVPPELVDEFSRDTQGIPQVLCGIDRRYCELATDATSSSDILLVLCIWGPFGAKFSEYSRDEGYPTYARLVLWFSSS